MKRALVSWLCLLPPGGPARLQETHAERGESGAELLAALAFAGEEREECLALALDLALRGDCEGALARLDAAQADSGKDDELARRVALERTRLLAWVELRDAFLAELAGSGKPLALDLDGKKVASAFTREGDELVLAKAPRARLSVRALAPEALLPAIPKERFAGTNEWLKIYPYCVAANPKWKRLTTSGGAADELKKDAEEFYPRLARLAPSVRAIEALATRAPPADRAGAEAMLAEIEALLALGRESACVRARLPRLGALADHALSLVSGAMELGELVHGTVSPGEGGNARLAYDFKAEAQAGDWLRAEDYLASLRPALDPVTAERARADSPVGPNGFRQNGEFCWRHALEFEAPMCVRYELCWEPVGRNQPSKVFAFALGMLSDEGERHVRVAELGNLYVDEQDGRYTAVRATGNASVQAGKPYAVELVHDGKTARVSIDGTVRAEAEAPDRKAGRVFLWGHSDLPISVTRLEIEGRVAPASLAERRAEWARAELERLGLARE